MERQRRSHPLLIAVIALVTLAIGAITVHAVLPPPEYIPVGPRAVLSGGACAEYGPSSGNQGPLIFVDPGHGGPDPGVIGATSAGKTVDEKTETLAVALLLERRLAHDGFRVVLSRMRDTSVVKVKPDYLTGPLYSVAGEHADIEARIACANAVHAALLLSIHFNGFTDPSVGGTTTVYDDARPFTARNLRFADLIQSSVTAAWARAGITIPNRGVAPDSSLGSPTITARAAAYGHILLLGPASPGWLADPTAMPGALSEPLFLTDGPEATLADSALGRHLLASAYARAIRRYYARKRI